MSKEKLYAVKNDKGEWLSFDSSHESVWDTNNPTFFKDKSYAEAQNTGLDGSHVVELTEKPTPVVVSEEEAKMLKKAKDTTVWRPAAVISKYAYNAVKDSDQEALLEDRLMCAYVIGLVVEQPKRYLIKVPHTDDSYFYKIDDEYCNAGDSYHLEGMTDKKWFTAAEIEHYGLHDFEKLEVTNDEQ